MMSQAKTIFKTAAKAGNRISQQKSFLKSDRLLAAGNSPMGRPLRGHATPAPSVEA